LKDILNVQKEMKPMLFYM